MIHIKFKLLTFETVRVEQFKMRDLMIIAELKVHMQIDPLSLARAQHQSLSLPKVELYYQFPSFLKE
jgi:hypothetical protein